MTEAKTYKAAIYRGIGSVDVVEKPYPQCGDDDVIVRNLMAGLCGSDLHAFRAGGDDHMIWKDFEFGHEVVSEVVEIGRNVTGLELGDRVFPNQGKALRDMSRMGTVGAFSEVIHIPQCEVGYSVLRLDNDVPLRSAVLFEPFVIGMRGARSLDPGPGKTAVVLGAGIIGLAAAVMLDWFGCDKVMVVDISDFRLENARRLGLLACNSAKEDIAARAKAEFGVSQTFMGERCGADLYLDAIGKPVAIETFARLAGRDAALSIVGVHHDPAPLDLMQLCYANWKIGGCGGMPIEDSVAEIMTMMRSGRYDLASLVTHEYPVDRIVDALVKGGEADAAQKVCIRFAD